MTVRKKTKTIEYYIKEYYQENGVATYLVATYKFGSGFVHIGHFLDLNVARMARDKSMRDRGVVAKPNAKGIESLPPDLIAKDNKKFKPTPEQSDANKLFKENRTRSMIEDKEARIATKELKMEEKVIKVVKQVKPEKRPEPTSRRVKKSTLPPTWQPNKATKHPDLSGMKHADGVFKIGDSWVGFYGKNRHYHDSPESARKDYNRRYGA